MGKEYKLDESELLSILEEVRDSLDSMIGTETVQKSEENEIVAKAEGSEEKPKKKEASKEGGSEEGESDPAAEVSADESAPVGEVAGAAPPPVAADPLDDSAMAAPADMSPMESAQAVSPEAAPADPAGQEAGVIEPAPTVAELQAEYDKLSDEELALHVMAAKAAANNRNAAAAPAAPDPMAAMAPAAPAPEAPMPPAPVMKSQSEVALEQSLKALEDELVKAKAEKEKQAKVIDELYEAYTRPVRKSLRFVSELPPSAPKVDVAKLSKEAVAQKLNEVTRDPELKKSDRDLVNKFYNGSVKIEALEHLLK